MSHILTDTYLLGHPRLCSLSEEQLVEEVIEGVRPEVVMVELDAERICLLPPGEAMEVRNSIRHFFLVSPTPPTQERFVAVTSPIWWGCVVHPHQRVPRNDEQFDES